MAGGPVEQPRRPMAADIVKCADCAVVAAQRNDRLAEIIERDVAGTLLGVLDLFSGGNFRLISVFALGVTPYITSSIILQLMTDRKSVV